VLDLMKLTELILDNFLIEMSEKNRSLIGSEQVKGSFAVLPY
jgi:hypothetical protein